MPILNETCSSYCAEILSHKIAYYLFKSIQIAAGLVITYLGYRLFILGVTGRASLSVNSSKLNAQLINAAPGLFFLLGGSSIVAWSIWVGN
jgi:hypothetical protein